MRYDFEVKQTEFRRPVWAFVDGMLKKPRALRRVAYLDTALALETMHLLSLGYRPENLYPINRSAAQLARLTQVLKERGLPTVNTRGSAGDFCETALIHSYDAVGWPDSTLAEQDFSTCWRLMGVET